MVAAFHQAPANIKAIRHKFGPVASGPGDPALLGDQEIIKAARSLGFKAKLARMGPEDIDGRVLPVIRKDLYDGYFILIGSTDSSGLPSADPLGALQADSLERLFLVYLFREEIAPRKLREPSWGPRRGSRARRP